MTWNNALTPQIWPSIFMLVLMVALSTYSASRRLVPGAASWMVASRLAAAWAAGSLLETAAEDLGEKIFWFKFQAVVQLPVIVAITCFVLEYAWPDQCIAGHYAEQNQQPNPALDPIWQVVPVACRHTEQDYLKTRAGIPLRRIGWDIAALH